MKPLGRATFGAAALVFALLPQSLPMAAQAPVAARPSILEDGTPVRMRLGRTLSSADARVGETVDFEVLEDVLVNGVVVIARGSNVTSTVTVAEAKRRMARGGKLDLAIDSVHLTNGERVALRGNQGGKGGGHVGAMTGAIVATSLVVWPAAPFFLMMHGKDFTLPKGTEVTAYTNRDIPLDLTNFKASPAPNVVSPIQNVPLATAERPTNGVAPTVPGIPAWACTATITSSVAGADVQVDGNFVGSTPAQVQIVAGDHTVYVSKRGFQPWSRTMKFTGGSALNLNADLDPVAPKRAQNR